MTGRLPWLEKDWFDSNSIFNEKLWMEFMQNLWKLELHELKKSFENIFHIGYYCFDEKHSK